MNISSSTISASADDGGPTTRRSQNQLRTEFTYLVSVYTVTFIVGSLFIGMCAPGCCYVLFSIVAGVSGFLMLRQSLVSRRICLGILLLSLFGMWREKETTDTWGQRALRMRLQQLEQELQQSQPRAKHLSKPDPNAASPDA